MPATVVTAKIASTHPVAKYPGWRLSRGVLESLGARLKAGDVPMLFDHDASKRVAAKVLNARVVPVDDLDWALEAEFEIDADTWAEIQGRFNNAGVPGGWSFSMTVPQLAPSSIGPAVTLAVDAAAWTDAERAEAGAALATIAPTKVDRLFQYSSLELATIYLILGTVTLNMASSAVYDALSHLVRRRIHPSRIEIERRSAAGNTVKAIVTTDDPEVVQAALTMLENDESDTPVRVFDIEKSRWLDP